jgi:hypothetical protein
MDRDTKGFGVHPIVADSPRADSRLRRPSDAWGPEGSGWRVWFAGNVVDGLCEVLDDHLAVERMQGVRWPAAIGCVPWLGSGDVVNRLLQMWTCVVVDKNELNLVPDRLINGRRRMPNTVLHMGRYRPDDFPPTKKTSLYPVRNPNTCMA